MRPFDTHSVNSTLRFPPAISGPVASVTAGSQLVKLRLQFLNAGFLPVDQLFADVVVKFSQLVQRKSR